MLKYALQRLVALVGLMLVMSALAFAAVKLVPADPAALAAGPGAQKTQIEELRKQLGLDQPMLTQYARYMSGLLRFNLGNSLITGRPIARDLGEHLPATLELAIASAIVFTVFGVGLGIVGAVVTRPGTQSALDIIALLGIAVPAYWLALAMQLLFYRELAWLPSGGRLAATAIPPETITGSYLLDSLFAGRFATFWDACRHLVLPVAAISAGRMSILARLMKASMVEVAAKRYVMTAHAKGLSSRRVLWRHVFRNALNPTVSALGLNIGYALGGQLLIEVIFSWPGLGRYAVESIQAFDYPAVVAVALLMLVVFGLINLAVDAVYPLLDPRVTYE